MKSYTFRLYVGPTAGPQISDRLRAHAMPWQHVTIEGTEHVHFSILALFEDAARTEARQWFVRAGFAQCFDYQAPRGFGLQLLRAVDA